ncbi:hypothetical protein YPPY55_4554, partial [Yersinia pestis PY-55]
MRKVTAGGFP